MPQEQPAPDPDPSAAGDTAKTDNAGAGGDTHIDEANTAAGSSGASAGSGPVDAGPKPSCSCSTQDDCCDGCQPKNENGSCGAGAGCMQPVCRAGTCDREIPGGFCLVAGVCYRAGQGVGTNACSYCDVSRSTSSLSHAAAGTACDDRSFCNGADSCDERGECSRHAGNPCPAGGCTVCRETEKACVPGTWSDGAGLEWSLWHDDPRMMLGEAKAACEKLALCGREDWRMPTIDELRTLIRGCPSTQTGGSCAVRAGGCLMSSCQAGCAGCGVATNQLPYWPVALGASALQHCSTTEVSNYPDNSWGVDFANGAVGEFESYPTCSLRCVRGGAR